LVLVIQFGESLLGAFGLIEADQRLHQHCTDRQEQQAWFGKASGKPFGGLEGGERVNVPAAPDLEHPTSHANGHPLGGLGFRSEHTLGSLEPRFCLLEPPLRDQHRSH
jgi:hypothetical protein